MPRKSKKTKRNGKNNASSNEQLFKKYKNINIGINFERWTNVKIRLNLESDEDFVDYLLNLAEHKLSKSELYDVIKPSKEQRCNNRNFKKFTDKTQEMHKFETSQELQSQPCKEEKRKHKKVTSIFNKTVNKKNLVVDIHDTEIKRDVDFGVQGSELKDESLNNNTNDDEEKENVGVLSCESQTRISTELSSPLMSDNVSKRTAVDVDSCDSTDILKESEQNLDFIKVVKKHKKKKANDGINCLSLEYSPSKLKKKKNKISTEIGKLPEPMIVTDNVASESCVITACVMEDDDNSPTENTQPDLIDRPSNQEPLNTNVDVAESGGSSVNSSEQMNNNCDVMINNTNNYKETQRLSITIKLCCDCDSRHLQDGCPLRNPQRTIRDSIEANNWFRSRSPNVQCRDEESSYEPTQNFASVSLPDCLELKEIDSDHGVSVVTREELPASTQFGPLIGQPIREMEIPDDFSMKNIWEVIEDGKCSYISTQDPDSSNWLRWLRPAPTREERNLAPIQIESKLYFITTVPVAKGEELLYWMDHISSIWSNKKMTKTNCGGCNLRFFHPIYYRRHCAVFHDPKFSLTIRKYHCKVCGLSVLGKENIMKHAADEHNGKGAYQCQYCKKFFLRLNYLEMHRTYGCAANPHRTRPLCDYCGRKFCQPQKLKIHIKRMHSEISEVLREFQCKRCMKVLGSRAALQRHIKEVHHKAMLGSCTCDKCGKMFQNKSNLKIHMLTHSGIKPFRCQQESCSAAFTTKQCLQFHYKKVHGFSDSRMPTIERSVAYTFDAYAGEMRPSSIDSDCTSNDSNTGDQDGEVEEMDIGVPEQLHNSTTSSTPNKQPGLLDSFNNQNLKFAFSENNSKLIASKASKKWMGESDKSDDLVIDFNSRSKDDDENLSKKNREAGPVSMLFQHCKPDSSNASLLVEAALDAAEKDIEMNCNPVKLPSPIHHHSNKISPFYPIIQTGSNILASPNRDIIKSVTPNPPNHLDYPLHSNMQDIGHLSGVHPLDAAGYPMSMSPTSRHTSGGYGLMFPDRTPHYELRLSPTAGPIDSFHLHPDDTRYDLHHPHRRLDVECSSDDGDGVQNLSLGLKNKSPPSLQLDLTSASYNKYDHGSIQDDHATNNFVESLEGLDMSRSSVYHHSSFVSMTSHRYPHALYDQRPSYSHSDVLRVVNLTHSVDLSLPRSGHLTIPPPSATNQPMIEPIRVLSPPSSYQSYPLSQSPYLPATRATHSPTYHHYSGY